MEHDWKELEDILQLFKKILLWDQHLKNWNIINNEMKKISEENPDQWKNYIIWLKNIEYDEWKKWCLKQDTNSRKFISYKTKQSYLWREWIELKQNEWKKYVKEIYLPIELDNFWLYEYEKLQRQIYSWVKAYKDWNKWKKYLINYKTIKENINYDYYYNNWIKISDEKQKMKQENPEKFNKILLAIKKNKYQIWKEWKNQRNLQNICNICKKKLMNDNIYWLRDFNIMLKRINNYNNNYVNEELCENCNNIEKKEISEWIEWNLYMRKNEWKYNTELYKEYLKLDIHIYFREEIELLFRQVYNWKNDIKEWNQLL